MKNKLRISMLLVLSIIVFPFCINALEPTGQSTTNKTEKNKIQAKLHLPSGLINLAKKPNVKIIPLKAKGDLAHKGTDFIVSLKDPFYLESFLNSTEQMSPTIETFVLNADGSINVEFELNNNIFLKRDSICGLDISFYYQDMLKKLNKENAIKETAAFYQNVFKGQDLPKNIDDLTNVYSVPIAIIDDDKYEFISLPYIYIENNSQI